MKFFLKQQQVNFNTLQRLQYLKNFIFFPRVSIHRMLQFNQYGYGNFAEKSPLMACYYWWTLYHERKQMKLRRACETYEFQYIKTTANVFFINLNDIKFHFVAIMFTNDWNLFCKWEINVRSLHYKDKF